MAIALGTFTQSPAGFTGTLKTLNVTATLTIACRRRARPASARRWFSAASIGCGPSWSRRSNSSPGTEDNLLRQVVYERLREDKPAAEVRRAVPYLKAGQRCSAQEKVSADRTPAAKLTWVGRLRPRNRPSLRSPRPRPNLRRSHVNYAGGAPSSARPRPLRRPARPRRRLATGPCCAPSFMPRSRRVICPAATLPPTSACPKAVFAADCCRTVRRRAPAISARFGAG
jgi:uncharacterized protein (DUF736 family)